MNFSGFVSVAPNVADANNAEGVPTGAITLWSTTTAPTGWLICDGATYSKFTYPRLFDVIGYTWGLAYGSSAAINNSVGSVSPTTQNTITFTAGSVPAALQIPGTRFIMSARGNNYNLLIWTVFSYSSGSPSVIVATATQNGTPVIFNTTPVTVAGTVTPIIENTFAVPNTSQRVVRGIYPTNYEIATSGGADTITISADNLPQHRHTINGGTGLGVITLNNSGFGSGTSNNYIGNGIKATDASGTNVGTYADDGTTKATNSAIDSRNAYVSIPYIIKF
jgi:microcystin-dependent protein